MASLALKTRKISSALSCKYDAPVLTTHQACKELLFRGRELSVVLGSNKLPSLKVKDVARFVVLHT